MNEKYRFRNPKVITQNPKNVTLHQAQTLKFQSKHVDLFLTSAKVYVPINSKTLGGCYKYATYTYVCTYVFWHMDMYIQRARR